MLRKAYQASKGDDNTSGSASASTRPSETNINPQQMVILMGPPGCGKTTLARSLKPFAYRDNGFYVSSRFDPSRSVHRNKHNITSQTTNNTNTHTTITANTNTNTNTTTNKQEQYSTLISALTQLAEHVLEKHPDRIQPIREGIANNIHPHEIGLLLEMIPCTRNFINNKHTSAAAAAAAAKNDKKSNTLSKSRHHEQPRDQLISDRRRYHIVLGSFLRVLCSPTHPMILFLDDLQFGDASSMELLRVLAISMRGVSGLLLVGGHNDVLATNTGQVKTMLQELEGERFVNVTKISLHHLSFDMVHTMIADILKLPSSQSNQLAKVAHEQTDGNALFLFCYLRFLYNQNILQFNDDTNDPYQMWRFHQDQTHSPSTAVTDLVINKIGSLSQMTQKCLRVASCLSKRIDDSALAFVLNPSRIGACLKEAEEAGLLVWASDSGGYSFIHEKVKEAARSMIPDDEYQQFHLQIGRRLWKAATPQILNDPDMLFLILQLLHIGFPLVTQPKERIALAELNCRAGNLALACSIAHDDAIMYFQRGIELISKSDCWTHHYDLSLKLYNGAIEACLRKSRFEQVRALVNIVIANTKSMTDRFEACRTLIKSLGQQENMRDVQAMGWQLLNQLGVVLPNKMNKTIFAAELLKVNFVLRGRDPFAMPKIKHSKKSRAIEIMSTIAPYMIMAKSPLTPFLGMRIIRLTLRYGFAKGSAIGFALHGMFVCALLGNVDDSIIFANTATTMLELEGMQEDLPSVYTILHSTVRPFDRPLYETLHPLRYASRAALESGDTTFYALTRILYIGNAFFSGLPLEHVFREALQYRNHLLEQKQDSVLLAMLPVLQICASLQGKNRHQGQTSNAESAPNSDPYHLSGEYLDPDQFIMSCGQVGNLIAVQLLYIVSAFYAYLTGGYQVSFDFILALEKNEPTNGAAPPTTCLKMFTLFLDAMVSLELYKSLDNDSSSVQLEKKKLRVRVRDRIRFVRKISMQCVSFGGFLVKLMHAEWISMFENISVESLYEEAIIEAKQGGYTHLAALGSERFSEHMVRRKNEVGYNLQRKKGKTYYLQWGATTKAATLKAGGPPGGSVCDSTRSTSSNEGGLLNTPESGTAATPPSS